MYSPGFYPGEDKALPRPPSVVKDLFREDVAGWSYLLLTQELLLGQSVGAPQ